MIRLALKMLIGNKASFIGIIFGIFLATLLISQQSAIFLGLISRSYRTLTDIPAPNIWVMDPTTESDDRSRSMPEGLLDIVRSVSGIEWAVPLSIAMVPLVTQSGTFEIGALFGIDEATLIGAPLEMIEGQAKDLRREGGIIIDVYSAHGSLATILPDGSKVPLKVGNELEINKQRAVVVGICKVTRRFYPQPIIFTSSSSFHTFAPSLANQISFILVKTLNTTNINQVQDRIESYPGLKALTKEEFKWEVIQSFLRTGILINFGLSLALGIIIGLSIAGQIFYRFTLENLMYYALIKAIGGTQIMILLMIIIQAFISGLIGFILGIAATLLWGFAVKDTTLAFLFPWQLLVFTGIIILLICIFTAALSIRKVFKTDPKILMGT